ncbi:DCXR [Branchiostoma lanceolatum]|uniref:DCXR protein n=1 Tax=Branchiostoma lanceolatum TaxID=7740 RepID=A0A8K0AEV1_BRALA|nr:DCXR [Branchiostoma lanceolatum]
MEVKFDGKRALVTGAGRGIGHALAKALLKCGAEVFALSLIQEELDSLVQEVCIQISIHPVQCDLADPEATKAAVESVGPIDLLVNNAGIIILESFLDVTLDAFDKVMNVNIRVNTVNPTVVMTDMGRMAWSDPAKSGPMLARIPLGKFVEVDNVVHAILFLLSDKAAMVNGIILPIEGGFLTS